MAPRKRKAEGQDEAVEKSEAKVAVTPTTRVTRSSSRRAVSGESPAVLVEKKKKNNKEKANAKELKEEVKPETDTKVSPEIASESEAQLESKSLGNLEGAGATKTIVIEHCKQCNSFKTRATKVKDGLEKAVPGITVRLNPDKPRRGCFEIREDGGEKFISLLDLKRPFKPMKDLDMDKVISDITDKIK